MKKLLLIGLLFISCGESKIEENSKTKKRTYEDYSFIFDDYSNCKKNIVIIKVKNCEYVVWINGYGSDMEHYEGCQNKEHKK